MSNSKFRSRRVMVIGLDGATLELIRPWAEAGILPTFRRLMAQGAWGELLSTLPPVTPTAWSSFLTGMNPGKHGLFDFVARRENGYTTYLVDASHRDGASLWWLLSQAGHRVIVFNVPITYPPEQVNGLMVSGLLTPIKATDASWPPELQRELQEAVPEFNFSPPGIFARGQEMAFVDSVIALNRTTLTATRYLMNRQPWEFLISVFMGTDIMSHFMWKHMETDGASAPEPEREVLANAIQNCYRQVDAMVAELMQEVGDDIYLIVMSDHGLGPMKRYMFVNPWLIDRGYLRFKRTPLTLLKHVMYRLNITPSTVYSWLWALGLGDTVRKTTRRSLNLSKKILDSAFISFSDVDWSRTRAYSMGYAGPIWINLQGREPQGIVEPGAEYEAGVDQLIADLRDLKEPDTGLPFVGQLYRRDEIYWGARAHHAPDIVFLPRDWRNASMGLFEFPSNRWLSPIPDRTGTHRMKGVVFLHGPGIRAGYPLEGASLTDVAPTVLALMGVPIPDTMDGQVLLAAMSDELREELTITYTDEAEGPQEPRPTSELSVEEEEELRKRLRGLGYVA